MEEFPSSADPGSSCVSPLPSEHLDPNPPPHYNDPSYVPGFLPGGMGVNDGFEGYKCKDIAIASTEELLKSIN